MFGLGKKKEADKTEKISQHTAGAEADDDIQFDFAEDDKLPFDDDEEFPEGAIDEGDGGQRRGLNSRTGLLAGLLLLLAIGGGGYYYLNSPPPPPQPAAPAKQKVAVKPAAPAPAPAAAVKPAPAAPVAVAPAKAAASAPVAATPAKAAAPAPVAATPAKAAAPAPVAATPAKAAAPAPVPATPAKTVKAAPAVAAIPTAANPFTLEAGVYINKENLSAVEKKIRRLGYTPNVQTTYSMVPMTRLLLGIYDAETAAARRKELAADVPDLFALKDGDQVALYAGSYLSVNLARSFADKLYKKGILADEETVSMRMAMKKISFGAFATREEADTAAKAAKRSGLSVKVAKQ